MGNFEGDGIVSILMRQSLYDCVLVHMSKLIEPCTKKGELIPQL